MNVSIDGRFTTIRSGEKKAMNSIRSQSLQILLEQDPNEKAIRTLQLNAETPIQADILIAEQSGIPGRPSKPELLSKLQTKKLSLRTDEGKAVLIHSLAHIELNAIDLALDIVWRFQGMPNQFYFGMAQGSQGRGISLLSFA